MDRNFRRLRYLRYADDFLIGVIGTKNECETIKADITKLKNAPNITLEPAGEGCVRVRGWGKAGHAAMPEGTVNAIGLVVNYLLDNGLCNEAERAYLEALRKLHASTAGTGLGIDCADGPFGPLTIIGGRI